MELDSLQLPTQPPSSSCLQELNGDNWANKNSALGAHGSLSQGQGKRWDADIVMGVRKGFKGEEFGWQG